MIKRAAAVWLSFFGFFIIATTACEMFSSGASVYSANRCDECHTIKGKGGAAGPNLTAVGSRRSREWIIQQIKNPSSHKENGSMPSFRHLPEKDINDLADYLFSLK